MSIYKMRTEFADKFGKIVLYILALIFVVGAVWQFGAAPVSKMMGNEEGGRVLATVNGYEITKNEFDAALAPTVEQAKQQGMNSTLQMANVRASVFGRLVQSRLLLSFAEREHIDISNSAVQAELDKRVVEYLKMDRRRTLRNVSGDQDRTDPREDRAYIDALRQYDMNISQREAEARAMNPESAIKTELASQGLREKIDKETGTVTDKDIEASYAQYKIDQIVIAPNSLPKEQIASKAEKLAVEAKKPGTDFAQLAKANPEVRDKTTSATYSFDSQFGYPPNVSKEIEKMKPGEVVGPITTPMGTYIVRLASILPNMPAKLDKKAKDARRDLIKSRKQMLVVMDMSQKMQDKSQITVIDNEMRGYYYMQLAQGSKFTDPGKYNKEMTLAEAAFKKQIKEVKNDAFSAVMYAQVLASMGKYKEAQGMLFSIIEGTSYSASGTDLRMMYGDVLVQMKDSKKAIEQYQAASDASSNDPSIHMELGQKYHNLGREDLATAEKAKADEIQKRLAELQAKMKAKTAPAPNGQKQPAAPTAPKAGG